MDDFCNIEKFKYFNVNNLYINIKKLKECDEIKLDLIINPKKVNNIDVI